jgi:hypothetical protein
MNVRIDLRRLEQVRKNTCNFVVNFGWFYFIGVKRIKNIN